MKSIIKTCVFASLVLGSVASCSDEFFDKSPNGAHDASKLDSNSIAFIRNSVYGYLGANLSGYSSPFLDGYADNGYSRNSWDSHGSSVQSNSLTAAQDFGYYFGYQGIRRCNLLMEKASTSGLSADLEAKYKAEARMMRAWLYMDLTLRFGDLPLVTEMSNDYPEGLNRTKAVEIRKFVLDELEAAATALPVTNDRGTFNKAQAYALKARAAYFFGEYQQALTAAKYVIDNGGYSLHRISALGDYQADADYFRQLYTAPGSANVDDLVRGIFSYQDIWRRDGSPEVIMAKEYLATDTKNSWLRVTAFQTPNMVNKQAWATIVPIQELVDAYWTLDGQTKPTLATKEERIAQYNALAATINTGATTAGITKTAYVASNLATVLNDVYTSQYKNRDPRLYATIVFPYSSINRYKAGEYQIYEPDIVNYGKSGFAFRKFSGTDDVVPIGGDAYYGTGVDWPVIRLAEMLLIAAEAHTQVTGYDGTAQAWLNQLRARVGMPNVPASFASKGAALDFIRAERRIEMAGEGLRFFDIRLYEDDTRNGGHKGTEAASAVMKGQIFDVTGNPGAKLTWASRLNLLPYHTSVLDKNKQPEAKKNNPDY